MMEWQNAHTSWRPSPAASECIGSRFVQQTQAAERLGLAGGRECVLDGRTGTVSTRRSLKRRGEGDQWPARKGRSQMIAKKASEEKEKWRCCNTLRTARSGDAPSISSRPLWGAVPVFGLLFFVSLLNPGGFLGSLGSGCGPALGGDFVDSVPVRTEYFDD